MSSGAQLALEHENLGPCLCFVFGPNLGPNGRWMLIVDSRTTGGTYFRFEDGFVVHDLSTNGLTTGLYSVTIAVPDGQRYHAGFVLR